MLAFVKLLRPQGARVITFLQYVLRYVTLTKCSYSTSTFYLAVDKTVSPPEEKEAIYSEAEDGNPKPVPVTEFLRYFKRKSENGAIVLREEFKVIQSNLY